MLRVVRKRFGSFATLKKSIPIFYISTLNLVANNSYIRYHTNGCCSLCFFLFLSNLRMETCNLQKGSV